MIASDLEIVLAKLPGQAHCAQTLSVLICFAGKAKAKRRGRKFSAQNTQNVRATLAVAH